MPGVTSEAYENAVRNAVMIEQFKTSSIKLIDPYLQNIERYIRQRLIFADLTTYRRTRLEKLQKAIRRYSAAQFQVFDAELTRELKGLARLQARWEAASMTQVIGSTFEATIPSAATLASAIVATPMSVRGISGSPLIKPFIKNFNAAQVGAIDGLIRQGVVEGATNSQILQNLRGTKILNYRDGLLGGQTLNQSRSMIRTAVRHVASVAQSQTALANEKEFPQYQWITTLDGRTSEICASLSLQIFPTGEGPLPPAHINCRSAVVYLADEKFAGLDAGGTQASTFGPVPKGQTYYQFTKNQNAKWQDFAIGKTHGKLLRNGGLSADEFAKLRLDKNFKPRTLAQMEKVNPGAFAKANITLDPATGRPIN